MIRAHISVPTDEMVLMKMRGIGKKKMQKLREAGLVIPYNRESQQVMKAREVVKYYQECLEKARIKLERLLASAGKEGA